MAAAERYNGGRPESIKELGDKAKDYEWNPAIPFKFWARAADALHHQVCLRPWAAVRCLWYIL